MKNVEHLDVTGIASLSKTPVELEWVREHCGPLVEGKGFIGFFARSCDLQIGLFSSFVGRLFSRPD